jgi:3-oxoacyl-[acyl-carrier protein] reductase
MEKRFTGKIVAVTGGCRGIGKAIVERFASEGARVFALDYIIPSEEEVFITNLDYKHLVVCIRCDVTQEQSVKDAFDKIINDTGRIDILVNNAGITKDNLIIRMSLDEWDTVINTNLKGAFLCSKTVAKQMMTQRYGKIINISSVVGITGNAGQSNYSSSKAGIIGFTKSLAKELASRNILVNCIAPGFVITPMTEKLTEEQKELYIKNIPLKRGALPSDIASGVVFFASEDANYITGQVLNIDGGLAM